MFSCKHREKHVCNLCCALISLSTEKNMFSICQLKFGLEILTLISFKYLSFEVGHPLSQKKRFWKIENKLRFWSDLIIKITTPIIFIIELWPLFLFNYFSVCHLHNSRQKIHTSSPLPVFSNFTLCLICLIMVSTNIASMLLSFCQ